MSLIGFEGFEGWIAGINATLFSNPNNALQWNVSPGAVNAGTLGGKKLTMTNTAFVTATFTTAQTDLIMGCRTNVSSIATTRDILTFRDGATIQCGLSVNTSGKLIFWRSTNATVLGTGTTTLVINSDYYIEVKVPFGNSVNVTVRLGGVDEIVMTGVDTTATANNSITNFNSVTPSGGIGWDLDDIYFLNSTGGGTFGDFLGIVRVETLFVSSNNSVTWTPLSSTNASNVDDTAIDSDTTYNSTFTAGNVDTFNHGSLSSSPTTIFAVKLSSWARKEDVAARTYRNKLISGGTTANGATLSLTTTYQLYEDYWTTDPDTSAAWSGASAVNATKIGYEMVS